MKSSNVKAFSIILLLLSLYNTALAQSVEITPDVDVRDYKISPDGSYVVYRSDQPRGLFSVPVSGGMSKRLDDPAERVSRFATYSFSPDGSRVVFPGGRGELYSSPVAGPTQHDPVVRLTPQLPEVDSYLYVPSDYRVSPDSTLVIYMAPQDSLGIVELFSTPIGGPDADNPIIKLNPDFISGQNITSYELHPSGNTVFYTANQDNSKSIRLYTVAISGFGPGSPTTALTPFLEDDENIDSFRINSSGKDVIYIANQDSPAKLELYHLNIEDNSMQKTPSKLNSELRESENVFLSKFSEDDADVIFTVGEYSEDYLDSFGTTRRDRIPRSLYSFTQGRSGTKRLTQATGLIIDFKVLSNYKGSGNSVVYSSWGPSTLNLYQVSTTGNSAPVQLTTKTNIRPSHYAISPNHRYLFYSASEVALNFKDTLHRIPLSGGESNEVFKFPQGTFIENISVASDNSRLIYRKRDNAFTSDMFSLRLNTCDATGLPSATTLCAENFEGFDWFNPIYSNVIEQSVIFSDVDALIAGARLDIRGLSHDRREDLSIELEAPDGTVLELVAPLNYEAANLAGQYRFADDKLTTLTSAALGMKIIPTGIYAPGDQSMIRSFSTSFSGKKAHGTWTLRFRDISAQKSGVLSNWRLVLLTEDDSEYFLITTTNGKTVLVGI